MTSPGRRYRRAGNTAKWVWIGVCLALTAGLVVGAISIMKQMDTRATQDRVAGVTDPAKLVEFLGSPSPAEREAAAKALREMGARAEAALKSGARSEDPEVARRAQELLVALAAATPAGTGAGQAAKAGPFPRRMLFVHISRYMYLNPLTAGPPGGADRSKAFAQRLAFDWRVPTDKNDSQLFLVSDTAPPPETVNPMKNVVVGAYEQFFATSRPQDRIIVYFGGHAMEIDGKAYLAPIEGDLEDPAGTLIPLDDFYAKMKACKATQKVVVWDVCRFNPERGNQRPGSDPMSEGLSKALLSPPEGVEAVVTCSPGENALEFFALQLEPGTRAGAYSGSSFLEAAKHVAEKAKAARPAGPNDLLPVADWVAAVGRRTTEMATAPVVGLKQTVQAAGKPRLPPADHNPDEPPARRFDYPAPPRGVPPTEIADLMQEFAVPPLKGDVAEAGLTELAFREEVLADYKADATADEILRDRAKYPLRAKVLEVVQTLKEVWVFGAGAGNKDALVVVEEVAAPITDAKKKEIASLLDNWAIGIARLELLDSELDALAPMLSGEAKRWQANFEYVRAALKYRLAYMKEYSKLMGDIRTETLPALDAKLGQDRYRLASSETMKNKKEAERLMEAAQEGFAKVIAEHKGTPWAIQAKRDKAFSLVLRWQPAGGGKPAE
jgi:hypothetical protein